MWIGMRQCSDREGSEGGVWGWREEGQRSIGRGVRGEAEVRDGELQFIALYQCARIGSLGGACQRKGLYRGNPGSNGVLAVCI